MRATSPPQQLIDPQGRPRLGWFDAPIPDLDVRGFLPPGSRRRVSRLRVKRWEYFGVASEGLLLGGAVVHLGYLANVFLYVFDRRSGRLHEEEALVPLGLGTTFDSNLLEGTISYRSRKGHVIIRNERAAAQRHLVDARLGEIGLSLRLDDTTPALAVATRNGFAGFNYTAKLAGLPASGDVQVGGRRWDLAEEQALGVLDFTVGCPQWATFWNWAAASGRLADGRRCGINFADGINETGLTENAVWVDGELTKVGSVRFEYDERDVLAPWHIRSWDGLVDLRFVPEGERRQDLNLGLVSSRFHQPFGSFSGTLVDRDGVRHEIPALHGFTEEHSARW